MTRRGARPTEDALAADAAMATPWTRPEHAGGP